MDAVIKRSRIVRQWLVGLLGSWACVWLAGPWVVNSILIRVADPELNAITLREGDSIRWRSEGWATTHVGPHGMPGWKPNGSLERVVLWGDSQVEGFCTNDDQKIHSHLIRLAEQAGRAIDCIPVGRSGTDAIDWIELLPAVDELWRPRMHVFVVAELSDLMVLDPHQRSTQEGDRWRSKSREPLRWVKSLRGEAAVQAARNLVLDPSTGRLRTLRWSIGPMNAKASSNDNSEIDASDGSLKDGSRVSSLHERIANVLAELHSTLQGRLCIVYAPAVPRFAGEVVFSHPDDASWDTLKSLLDQRSILAIDCRQAFIDQWNLSHTVTRGFHQGQMSYGHLNDLGNHVISMAIIEQLQVNDLLGQQGAGAAK